MAWTATRKLPARAVIESKSPTQRFVPSSCAATITLPPVRLSSPHDPQPRGRGLPRMGLAERAERSLTPAQVDSFVQNSQPYNGPEPGGQRVTANSFPRSQAQSQLAASGRTRRTAVTSIIARSSCTHVPRAGSVKFRPLPCDGRVLALEAVSWDKTAHDVAACVAGACSATDRDVPRATVDGSAKPHWRSRRADSNR
jgi:hypothetical protein